ncbi:hypothetical protein [Ktedonospora formicarum]|uniref:Uncharacterized protein n=1 Tax=Ktedonospora formicarum TaxID=2778364 RepID=A0A8J3I0R6_9CHLR|nr:hypothetical protein [Ktedonospora formicarum]GHO44558.1 hypothetical protein KSX_27210 [Ktedonospora formicarum]
MEGMRRRGYTVGPDFRLKTVFVDEGPHEMVFYSEEGQMLVVGHDLYFDHKDALVAASYTLHDKLKQIKVAMDELQAEFDREGIKNPIQRTPV